MTRARQLLVGAAALAAGAGTAGAVALGAADGTATITIIGDQVAQERQGKLPVLTVIGNQRVQQVITINGRPFTARAGADFNVKPQVITISGDQRTQAVTLQGGIVNDEEDEPQEQFYVEACSAGGEDEDCDGTTDEDERTAHPITIADDDGALDAAICSGLLRPVGLLLGQLKIAGLFEGCSA